MTTSWLTCRYCVMRFLEEKTEVANVIWQKKHTRANDAKFFSDTHDYVLAATKSISSLQLNLFSRTQEMIDANYLNPDNDEKVVSSPIQAKTPNPDYIYPITTPTGIVREPPGGTSWQFSQEAFFCDMWKITTYGLVQTVEECLERRNSRQYSRCCFQGKAIWYSAPNDLAPQ